MPAKTGRLAHALVTFDKVTESKKQLTGKDLLKINIRKMLFFLEHFKPT